MGHELLVALVFFAIFVLFVVLLSQWKDAIYEMLPHLYQIFPLFFWVLFYCLEYVIVLLFNGKHSFTEDLIDDIF